MASVCKLFAIIAILLEVRNCQGYNDTNNLLGSTPIGAACSSDEDCLGFPETTVCDPLIQICHCNVDHVLVDIDLEQRCEPIRNEIGDECVSTQQCTRGVPGEFSDCLPVNSNPFSPKICNCIEGAFHQQGDHKCLLNADQIGDPCEINEQCQNNLGDNSECHENRCQCNTESIPSSDNTKCLLIAQLIGAACEITDQCVLGTPGQWSQCSSGICQCQDTAIADPGRNVCLRKAENIGDTCEADIQCSANLGEMVECNMNGQCQCKDGAVPIGNVCIEDLQNEIGGNCTDDGQCQRGQPGELSICENEICTCDSEAINELGENVCRRKANYLGDSCIRNAQCKANLGELSECLLGEVCTCTPRYGVPSLLGNRCLPVINFIGGECEERQQCTSGTPGFYSDCMESLVIPGMKICNCTDGAANEPGKHECLMEAALIGEFCEDDDQCVGEPGISSVCSTERRACGCLGGFIPSLLNDDCLQIRKQIGESCKLSEQCRMGAPGYLSECSTEAGICECSSGSIIEVGENVCRPVSGLSGPCQVNAQCIGGLGEHSQCVGGFCECTKNAIPDGSRKKCVLNESLM